MGLLLAIDTAGSRCQVAVADESGAVLAKREPDLGRGHAEHLAGLVRDALSEAGASFADLSRIAVTVGPGSFTGLRVGVAAARGFALALGVPAVGVSTLEALAEPHRGRGPVLCLLDAKRGEAYAACYAADGEALLAPSAIPLEALGEAVSALPRPAAIAGSGAFLLDGLTAFAEIPRFAPDGHVEIASVARLGLGKSVIEPPRPLYLRGADAKPQSRTVSLLA
ncbi:tRNA (adenosine(37)-N6)-threonylcarbamoyltransferase complex dimerization subunit type 1 TsaB [Aureimonas psammosilenae]|uniref:tRNA (adenosine(37)-N6)-threonylcarbamoyltransferase complex dimerization subunit type 1 TsaB n=1 Tax=Aureimonas psammosilenae TaxID=2495496 RepID=UPI001260C83C|nr:tRNA (adenosine(37)-N6)-threonylcarbamoyltransferase complex dimerization subunit type 1 TsaB [Aureimonas psammosilenae]